MLDERWCAGAGMLLFLLCGSLGWPAWAATPSRPDTASLYRRALAYEARNTFESRRRARECLEEATAREPDNVSCQLELGGLYYRMGFLKLARQRFERVRALNPNNPEARIGLGQVWLRDYLKYLDLGSLDRSIAELDEAVRIRPGDCDGWLDLVPLLVEKHNPRAALAAARRARDADPARPEALLALGHAAFRVGDVSTADAAFRDAIPRLPREVRARFQDIAPVASERDTAALRRLPPTEREEFVRRFWKEHDPDLTSLENEAQLEYWSRVTQAYFLFFNPRLREWDQRGEVYVRYGPPSEAIYNPVGGPNRFQIGEHGSYPMNLLVWAYPDLGMVVSMQDRLLSGRYLRPLSLEQDPDPAPDPDSLAKRVDLLATRGGRGVFPMFPPGAKPLEVSGVLAQFQGSKEPRLTGLVEVAGGPSDSLWAEWVVLDSARHEVARAQRTLSPSRCDPAAWRAGDFAADLPPGEYLAGISVHGRDGSRGIFRAPVHLGPAAPALELSDVVVSCGSPEVDPATGDRPPAVRLGANPAGRVSGEGPLTVYFEIYHLLPDAAGTSRVEFQYTVRSAERDPRIWIQRWLAPRPSLPDISASRTEDQAGTLRRQFVTVPIRSLPVGRYRLEVRVRDVNSGGEAVKSVDFVKQAPHTAAG